MHEDVHLAVMMSPASGERARKPGVPVAGHPAELCRSTAAGISPASIRDRADDSWLSHLHRQSFLPGTIL